MVVDVVIKPNIVDNTPAPKSLPEGGAGGSRAHLRLLRIQARRCKLDPGLKAPRFQSLIAERIHGAFNLNPLFSSLRHYIQVPVLPGVSGEVGGLLLPNTGSL